MNKQTCTSIITDITVYFDKAMVTRKASFSVEYPKEKNLAGL